MNHGAFSIVMVGQAEWRERHQQTAADSDCTYRRVRGGLELQEELTSEEIFCSTFKWSSGQSFFDDGHSKPHAKSSVEQKDNQALLCSTYLVNWQFCYEEKETEKPSGVSAHTRHIQTYKAGLSLVSNRM